MEPPKPPPDVWEYLQQRLTDQRRQRMLHVAANRTRYLKLVVQDIHHPHNVSACMRSADAFGVQNVDVVTMTEQFRPSTVARGVAGWLDINKYPDVKSCAEQLRADGFRLATGLPRPDATPLDELPLDKPLAVVFGNEHAGVHPDWQSYIDLPFTIPMVGMVESLNISVSAAITLRELSRRLRAERPDDATLSANAQTELLNEWICRQVPSWEQELARLRPS